jgi:hypothetical protein
MIDKKTTITPSVYTLNTDVHTVARNKLCDTLDPSLMVNIPIGYGRRCITQHVLMA